MLIYDALRKDHETVKQLLNELTRLDENDDHHFELVEQIRDELIPHSRAEALKAALEDHVQEEESTLFALGKKVFTSEEAEKIGQAFEELKPQIKKEGFLNTTLDMVANLMPPRFQSSILKDAKE